MNLDDYSYAENDRRYIKPEVGLNESNAFIDNLRSTVQEENTRNNQLTYNLGSDLPSNMGGLSGSSGYFQSRYQTPQVNSMVSDLRATAQAQALQEAMNNELNKAKKLYTDAYRAAKKREAENNKTTDDDDDDLTKDLTGFDVEENDSENLKDTDPVRLEESGESSPYARYKEVTDDEGNVIGTGVTWYPHSNPWESFLSRYQMIVDDGYSNTADWIKRYLLNPIVTSPMKFNGK